MELTHGNFFSGSGTWELAAKMAGIKTLWESEIEPFPVALEAKRFPEATQLGDITKVNGAKIEPVTILSNSSPCQDLSVAGKRKGLDGERSGLFMEVIRITKEMRANDARNGRIGADVRPRFWMWENVPGAFSSHNGEDFKTVLEEIAKVVNEDANVPKPEKWSYSGCLDGDGYQIAYRTMDAQFWGVPQRRRRIFLVADFAGHRASEILFECEGLRRDFKTINKTWQDTNYLETFRMKITYFTKDDMVIVEDEVEEIVIEHNNGIKAIQDDDEARLFHILDNKQ